MSERIDTFIPIPGHFKGGPMDGLPFQLTSPVDAEGEGPRFGGAFLSYKIEGSWHGYRLRPLEGEPYQEMSYVGVQHPPPGARKD